MNAKAAYIFPLDAMSDQGSFHRSPRQLLCGDPFAAFAVVASDHSRSGCGACGIPFHCRTFVRVSSVFCESRAPNLASRERKNTLTTVVDLPCFRTKTEEVTRCFSRSYVTNLKYVNRLTRVSHSPREQLTSPHWANFFALLWAKPEVCTPIAGF